MNRFTNKQDGSYTIKYDIDLIGNATKKLGILEDFEELLDFDIIEFLEILLENKNIYIVELGVCHNVKLTGIKVYDGKLIFEYNYFFSTTKIFKNKVDCERYINGNNG